MDSSQSQSKYPLVPPGEQKCVWMTAGILSYQLCERQFDCDQCPLDSALRTFPHRSSSMEVISPLRTKTSERANLIPGLLYSRKHCWIRSQSETVVRIGIEPLLSSLIAGPKTVVLPSIGERVQANRICAWIVTEGGTMPISSPLDGEISNVNSTLMNQPHDLCDDPLDHGWLFELTTGEEIFNKSNLFPMNEAEKIYSDDDRRFQTLVNNEIKRHHSTAGPMLQDGGQIVQNLSAMLGPEKYFELLRDIFS